MFGGKHDSTRFREGLCRNYLGLGVSGERTGLFGGLRKAIDEERRPDSVSQLSAQPHPPFYLFSSSASKNCFSRVSSLTSTSSIRF